MLYNHNLNFKLSRKRNQKPLPVNREGFWFHPQCKTKTRGFFYSITIFLFTIVFSPTAFNKYIPLEMPVRSIVLA